MDLKHGDDIYDSFRDLPERLLREYASMADEFHFRVLDARRSDRQHPGRAAQAGRRVPRAAEDKRPRPEVPGHSRLAGARRLRISAPSIRRRRLVSSVDLIVPERIEDRSRARIEQRRQPPTYSCAEVRSAASPWCIVGQRRRVRCARRASCCSRTGAARRRSRDRTSSPSRRAPAEVAVLAATNSPSPVKSPTIGTIGQVGIP